MTKDQFGGIYDAHLDAYRITGPSGGITMTAKEMYEKMVASRPTVNKDPLHRDLTSKGFRLDLLTKRFNQSEYGPMPFEFLDTHLADDKVFIFVVKGVVPVTLEDDARMFPSDTLITQLRLLA